MPDYLPGNSRGSLSPSGFPDASTRLPVAAEGTPSSAPKGAGTGGLPSGAGPHSNALRAQHVLGGTVKCKAACHTGSMSASETPAHKGTVTPRPPEPPSFAEKANAGLTWAGLPLCVMRKEKQRRRGKAWGPLAAGIVLISSRVLSLTQKGLECTSLPLLRHWDVAAAVWVLWRPATGGGRKNTGAPQTRQ